MSLIEKAMEPESWQPSPNMTLADIQREDAILREVEEYSDSFHPIQEIWNGRMVLA